MRLLFTTAIMGLSLATQAQSYRDSILQHRQHYKQEFIEEERSPLKGNDTAFLRFFEPDKNYRVSAQFQLTPDTKTFYMPTSSGKTKLYRQYGLVHFKIGNKPCSLQVLQSQALIKDPKDKDDLFIPFTDETTYDETYGGGRYLDIKTTDIVNGKVTLDFNKCYNPYCAFAGGYNCPIPPTENRLKVAIRAGEKQFGKQVEH